MSIIQMMWICEGDMNIFGQKILSVLSVFYVKYKLCIQHFTKKSSNQCFSVNIYLHLFFYVSLTVTNLQRITLQPPSAPLSIFIPFQLVFLPTTSRF